LYNGQGKLTQLSGAFYEGLWVNGFPECMASKLAITGVESGVCLAPGEPFSIIVECRSADDTLVEGLSLYKSCIHTLLNW
jgi:hypothetical protein